MIRSGALAGVGTQLLWALDGFGKGVFRSRMAGKLMKVLFCWLRLFDRLAPDAYNIDSAAEVFFWGRKSEHTLAPKAAIAHYQGCTAEVIKKVLARAREHARVLICKCAKRSASPKDLRDATFHCVHYAPSHLSLTTAYVTSGTGGCWWRHLIRIGLRHWGRKWWRLNGNSLESLEVAGCGVRWQAGRRRFIWRS